MYLLPIKCRRLDRFSRDQEDTAALYKRLRFLGISFVTLSEGEINELHVGFKGTMNALFLKDLAEKTHRGLRGRIEDGKSAGGLCYGYRVVKTLSGGIVTTGEREIDPTQASIVERIFRDFIAGVSPKQIAKNLNREGIAGPFGGPWSPSTIYGNSKRGTGILNNESYIGLLVWNQILHHKANYANAYLLFGFPAAVAVWTVAFGVFGWLWIRAKIHALMRSLRTLRWMELRSDALIGSATQHASPSSIIDE